MEAEPMIKTKIPGLVINLEDLVNFQRATERQKVLSHYSGEITSSNDNESR